MSCAPYADIQKFTNSVEDRIISSNLMLKEVFNKGDEGKLLFKTFLAIFGPAFVIGAVLSSAPLYSFAKFFEMSERDKVQYPGTLAQYIVDKGNISGSITGFFEGAFGQAYHRAFDNISHPSDYSIRDSSFFADNSDSPPGPSPELIRASNLMTNNTQTQNTSVRI
jgi:hypothetical protein